MPENDESRPHSGSRDNAQPEGYRDGTLEGLRWAVDHLKIAAAAHVAGEGERAVQVIDDTLIGLTDTLADLRRLVEAAHA